MTCDVCNLERPTQPVTDRSGLIRDACSECAGVIGAKHDTCAFCGGRCCERSPLPFVRVIDCDGTTLAAQLAAAQPDQLILQDAVDPRIAALKAALVEACVVADSLVSLSKMSSAHCSMTRVRIAELRKLAEGA